jgi:hypothetical protein
MSNGLTTLNESPRMTVWAECRNRSGCRMGLKGVQVELKNGHSAQVRGSTWNANGQLMLLLQGLEEEILATEVYLMGFWPSPCCQPSIPNRFNTEGFDDQANG